MQYVSELKPIDLNEVAEMASDARGQIRNIFLHWSAGRYGQVYEDYHISIDYDGRIYVPDNCHNLMQYRVHTYQRNTRSVAVCLCGCYDASANNGYNSNFGSEGVTQAQIEAMAAVVAKLVKYGDVPIEQVLTHQEIASIDGYGPYSGDPQTRWDLWYLPDSAFNGELKPGGGVIRGKAMWYLQQGGL